MPTLVGAVKDGVVKEKTNEKLVIVLDDGTTTSFVPSKAVLEGKVNESSSFQLKYKDVEVGDRITVQFSRPDRKTDTIESLKMIKKAKKV